MTEETKDKDKHLEGGTYEIIRNRLVQQGKDLKDRLIKLNASRKTVFGSIENTLLGSERIITRNNCIPRDMTPVDHRFIFGYNVHMGLKTQIKVGDVFAVYEYVDRQFRELSTDMLSDAKFETDFKELYKYYKLTRLVKLFVLEPYLYMVFQVGKEVTDIKAFKWLIKDSELTYVDNRSDHEVRFPPQHDFEWKRSRREQHRYGSHPHISIEDRLFVETVGGDLTIKVEDNTETGQGIYAEEVEDKDQTLDDAETYYAIVGNLILLKMRPYQEKNFRYFVFNEKLQHVTRIDTIKDACILLPDGHGLIFPNGYYLQSGEYKMFDIQLEGMVFEKRVAAPNGEDFQYFFYNRETGVYLILSYNLISQSVEPPIVCSGYSHFDNGEMILFKAEDEPRKNHVLQIWQTPYVGKNFVTEAASDSLLYKIGNQEVVHCMAQCQSVINLIRKEESYLNLYVDIEKEASNILDSYFWIAKNEAFNLKEVVENIRVTAASAVEEYEKVVRIKNASRRQIAEVKDKAAAIFKEVSYASFDTVNDYVSALTSLRIIRGEIISLKDLRYTDLPLVESLEEEVRVKSEELSAKCVEFLLRPEGLEPYRVKVEEQKQAISGITKGSEGKALGEEITQTSNDLELLIDVVGNLKIEDPTQTTEIIDRISTVYASLNQVKGILAARMKELQAAEGEAEFNSQLKLVDQAVVNYLGTADTPGKCDEYLTRMMVQLEELEGKFADFEEFILLLTEKREELYSAFESKKLAILEKQNKKANALLTAADRILNGLKNRLESFKTVNEINGYFASDLMVEKLRDIVEQLLGMGDTVKADDIQGRMKTIREDAVRQLKDRQDLFVEGENLIRFGKHLFTVNMQNLDLSLVRRGDALYFHMTGTDFRQLVDIPELYDLREVWEQEVVSENEHVYRAEYLAYKILQEASPGKTANMEQLGKMGEEELLSYVRQFMAPRYSEGYTKGLHDEDGAKILNALLTMHRSIDLLVYSPPARAMAALYWRKAEGKEARALINKRLRGLNKVSRFFNRSENLENFVRVVEAELEAFATGTGLFDKGLVPEAAKYLCREVMRGDTFVTSSEAEAIYSSFMEALKAKHAEMEFAHSLEELSGDLAGAFYLTHEWLEAFARENGGIPDSDRQFIDEVTALLLLDGYAMTNVIPVKTSMELEGLHGSHPGLDSGKYILSYSLFMQKMRHFDTQVVPRFHRFQELKKTAADEFRTKLRLDEFKSRVLSSFVRNKLIDKVYLPLVGDNLAKQIGAAGETKRTDLMGLLLLISPPGYGKTTLMEYIANRLGIIFVKVNGPAIGHGVTSLDPEEVRNTGAKEELKKLNLAFEMGNNIMIYVDDIQHCSPEFLQKFISLCDAQRKIEGIYNGVGKTYDLRGKKVAVVMAGNPYTESGEKFKIPDMLANRADVYNLGDMLRENEEAFMLSYIENSLTSNPVMNKLITRSRDDVYKLIDAAQGAGMEGVELDGNYASEEVGEFISVLKKLFRVRDVVLDINREYIHSAAQAAEYRTEPPFKLQGSYRNMNRIAERIVPVMNDEELESIIEGSYENDAQTLATGAESNLLKWKEITGRLNAKEKSRWEEIKGVYNKGKLVQSEDKAGQVILQLSEVGDRLTGIKDAISKGIEGIRKREVPETVEPGQAIIDGFRHLKDVIAGGFSVLEKGLASYAEAAQVRAQAAAAAVHAQAEAPKQESAAEPAKSQGMEREILQVPVEAAGAVPTEKLEVTIELFRVVPFETVRKMVERTRSLIEKSVSFGEAYYLINASIDHVAKEKRLLLVWQCLRTQTGLEEQEKIDIVLLKSGKKVWGFEPKLGSTGVLHREGDYIYGSIRLPEKLFAVSDQMGIRLNQLMPDGKWHGLVVESGHPSDQGSKRFLIDLKFYQKY